MVRCYTDNGTSFTTRFHIPGYYYVVEDQQADEIVPTIMNLIYNQQAL